MASQNSVDVASQEYDNASSHDEHRYASADILFNSNSSVVSFETDTISSSQSDLDDLYIPCTSSDSESEDESVSVSNSKSIISDNKFIVFESCLDDLICRCKKCGKAIVENKKRFIGSALSLEITCINGHTTKWNSQPFINRMAAGNLLLCSAILFSGNTFSRISQFAQFSNLKFPRKDCYNSIQKLYLFPTIHSYWSSQQKTILKDLKKKTKVSLAGDGRCDSPGFSAKYGTYTFMNQENNQIVDMRVTHVSEAKNSNAMEKFAFEKS